MQLVTIPGTMFQLDAPAEASLARAITDGCPVEITSAYRSPAFQERLIALHEAQPTKYAVAIPVNQSEHCIGNAVDTGNTAETGAMQRWLMAHKDYGWVQTALPDEPWHFAYRIALDQHIPLTLPVRKARPMFLALDPQNRGMLMLSDGTWGWISSATTYAQLKAAGIPDTGHWDADSVTSVFTPGRRRS